ncbi:hypothetical protein D770_07285 [Flammeovirgaceae bacterium 311]|nr:hypothetical protein D770_07285 [Flammeovirgaceae bacterium 311]
MEIYTDPDSIIQELTSLLKDENPGNWRIGVGLIRTLGNPYELGVEQIFIYQCSPKITLQVIDYMVKNYGVLRDSGWTYPEINNMELVLYKKKTKSLAA